MRHFRTRSFTRWAKTAKLADSVLSEALIDLKKNKSISNLGGGLFKIRIAKKGRGKSAGYRTIIAVQKEKRSIFLIGFGKNEKANISDRELSDLKDLAKMYANFTTEEFNLLVSTGAMIEFEEV